MRAYSGATPSERRETVAGRNEDEVKDELNRLLAEEIESLKTQTFGGLDKQGLKEQEDRLKRIREVSADYLAILKKKNSQGI